MSRWIAAALAALLLAGCSRSDEDRCNSTGTAYVMSQNFVKKELRSPSEAKFPSSTAPGVTVQNTSQCVHEIISYVDAPNAFGATSRMGYYAKIEGVLGTNNWRILELDLYE